MWIAVLRKFSQVSRLCVFSLLRLYLLEVPANESLIATLLHVFSKRLIFLFFFPCLYIVYSSFASYAAYQLASKTKPRHFHGVVNMGINLRKAAWPISQGAGWVEKEQCLKPNCKRSLSCWGSSSVPCLPQDTAISCTVVYLGAKGATIFPVKLKLNVPYGVEMVKSLMPNIWDFSLSRQLLVGFF